MTRENFYKKWRQSARDYQALQFEYMKTRNQLAIARAAAVAFFFLGCLVFFF